MTTVTTVKTTPITGNGAKEAPKAPEAPEVAVKKEGGPKKTRGPSKPALMPIADFVRALKGCKNLEDLYRETRLPREQASYAWMRDTYRILEAKGLKLPAILEFEKASRTKYNVAELAAILGVEVPEPKK